MLRISCFVLLLEVAISFEMTQKLWEMKPVDNTGPLINTTYPALMAASPIECAVTAFTYNRSLAIYDKSSHGCHFRGVNEKAEMTDGAHTLYIRIGDIKTCGDLDPASLSGVYRITPVPGNSFDVYCDMDSEGGPWTVIQNRKSIDVDFFRTWKQYKDGFGDLLGNFWLGNDHIHILTTTLCILRIQLQSMKGAYGYAEYLQFQIANEMNAFRLSVDGFRGNISDAFGKNDGELFSTPDRDNDRLDFDKCTKRRRGAWWYRSCSAANLNGVYNAIEDQVSMYWKGFFFKKSSFDQMKASRMMIKKT